MKTLGRVMGRPAARPSVATKVEVTHPIADITSPVAAASVRLPDRMDTFNADRPVAAIAWHRIVEETFVSPLVHSGCATRRQAGACTPPSKPKSHGRVLDGSTVCRYTMMNARRRVGPGDRRRGRRDGGVARPQPRQCGRPPARR